MTQKERLDTLEYSLERLETELEERTQRLAEALSSLALGQVELRRTVTETRWLRFRRWFAQWIYSGPEVPA